MAECLKKLFRGGLVLFALFFLAHCAMGGTEVGNPRPGGTETSGDDQGPVLDEEASPSPTPEGEMILEEEF